MVSKDIVELKNGDIIHLHKATIKNDCKQWYIVGKTDDEEIMKINFSDIFSLTKETNDSQNKDINEDPFQRNGGITKSCSKNYKKAKSSTIKKSTTIMDNLEKITQEANAGIEDKPFVYNRSSRSVYNVVEHYDGNDIELKKIGNDVYEITKTDWYEVVEGVSAAAARLRNLYSPQN